MEITFSGTHRQAVTGQLFSYRATYGMRGIRVSWSARVTRRDDVIGTPSGTIDIPDDTTNAAQEAVVASVNSWIDLLSH